MENKSCQTDLISFLMRLQVWVIEVTVLTHPDICKTFDLEEQNLLRKLNNTNPVLHRCGGLVVTLSCWRVFMFLPKEIMNNFIK